MKRIFLVSLLGACVADHPAPPPIPTSTVSGVVEIDSAIANATVYLDFNDNNLLDGGEPQATTDATGHFTLTWDNPAGTYPRTIGAIAGPKAAAGPAMHMRAPFGDQVVISPFTTLVVSEMANDLTLTQSAAAAKIASALSASQLPFSGQPLDVMADYASATSGDGLQLRYAATTIAAVVSGAVEAGNGAQSTIDCNDATFFTPAVAAMDKQLTAIANGTSKFAQLTAAQQADVVQNPTSYQNYFIDTTALANDIESALLAAGEDLAAALFAEFEQKFVEQLTDVCVGLAAELLQAFIEALI